MSTSDQVRAILGGTIAGLPGRSGVPTAPRRAQRAGPDRPPAQPADPDRAGRHAQGRQVHAGECPCRARTSRRPTPPRPPASSPGSGTARRPRSPRITAAAAGPTCRSPAPPRRGPHVRLRQPRPRGRRRPRRRMAGRRADRHHDHRHPRHVVAVARCLGSGPCGCWCPRTVCRGSTRWCSCCGPSTPPTSRCSSRSANSSAVPRARWASSAWRRGPTRSARAASTR